MSGVLLANQFLLAKKCGVFSYESAAGTSSAQAFSYTP